MYNKKYYVCSMHAASAHTKHVNQQQLFGNMETGYEYSRRKISVYEFIRKNWA